MGLGSCIWIWIPNMGKFLELDLTLWLYLVLLCLCGLIKHAVFSTKKNHISWLKKNSSWYMHNLDGLNSFQQDTNDATMAQEHYFMYNLMNCLKELCISFGGKLEEPKKSTMMPPQSESQWLSVLI